MTQYEIFSSSGMQTTDGESKVVRLLVEQNKISHRSEIHETDESGTMG